MSGRRSGQSGQAAVETLLALVPATLLASGALLASGSIIADQVALTTGAGRMAAAVVAGQQPVEAGDVLPRRLADARVTHHAGGRIELSAAPSLAALLPVGGIRLRAASGGAVPGADSGAAFATGAAASGTGAPRAGAGQQGGAR